MRVKSAFERITQPTHGIRTWQQQQHPLMRRNTVMKKEEEEATAALLLEAPHTH